MLPNVTPHYTQICYYDIREFSRQKRFLIAEKGIVADGSSSLFTWEKIMDYYGSKWKKKRKHILMLDGYVCQVSRMYGRTEEATVVHHIYPADIYPEWAWEDWNLISVSMATHNQLENRQTGELTEEGLRLQQMIQPGEDWRKRRAGK